MSESKSITPVREPYALLKAVKEALNQAGYNVAPKYYTRKQARIFKEQIQIGAAMLELDVTDQNAIKSTLDVVKFMEYKYAPQDGLYWIDVKKRFTVRDGCFIELDVYFWRWK